MQTSTLVLAVLFLAAPVVLLGTGSVAAPPAFTQVLVPSLWGCTLLIVSAILSTAKRRP